MPATSSRLVSAINLQYRVVADNNAARHISHPFSYLTDYRRPKGCAVAKQIYGPLIPSSNLPKSGMLSRMLNAMEILVVRQLVCEKQKCYTPFRL